MRRALAAAAAVALAVPAAAAGHSQPGGGANPYVSRVTSVTPSVPGLTVTVVGGDDRLRLRNDSGRMITVLGYEGEPYLRIGPDGVRINRNSPAEYLNRDRYGKTKVPVKASARPRWVQVGASRSWDWHDHRIHWMSPLGPPQVRANPKARQNVEDWQVPILVGSQRGRIVGTLDYVPVGGGGSAWISWAIAVGSVAVAGAAYLLLKRLRPAPRRR